MQNELREQFNRNFTQEKYVSYLKQLDVLHPGIIDFRVAETPVFITKKFAQQMLDACAHIIDLIISPEFKNITKDSIPKNEKVPDENEYPECLSFDFGICEAADGSIVPQLVEMQGFPSLFAFQIFLAEQTAAYADLPDNYSSYLNGYTKNTYIQLLKEIVLNGHDEENVILLDIFPEQQKTKMDFYCTKDIWGIKTVCVTKLIAEGDQLFYDDNGIKTRIKRIYNRLIMDDLKQQEAAHTIIDLTKSYDVEWITHPNWFYRISKYTLPFLHHSYIPETFFLNEIKQLKDGLENYVLKPLFSFAGMGVVIDVTQKDIDTINDPWNWILQRKAKYANIIKTPDGPAKAEVRLFYFWKKGAKRPIAVHNLARLSKGAMIGTRYNKDKTWVGGTIAFFEQ
jgi:hypothetical protein